MLRTASAAFALIAVLPVFSVLPSSFAEAGSCSPGYDGCYVVPDPCGYFGDCARIYRDRATTYRTYRSGYDGPRSYGGADRPPRMAPYFVNGCYNGYSADGVYCHYLYRCPYTGYRY